MRILIVEDDLMMLDLLSNQFKKEEYSVDSVSDGSVALDYIEMTNYDCIILDIMLPGVDGLTVLKKLRLKQIQSPVILLTAKDTVSDRIKGLDAGADDYLIKPFSLDELSARVRALLRRKSDNKSPIISIGDLTMDTLTHRVCRNGEEIDLTPKEYSILEYFMRNQGKILSREQIIEHIWNFDFESDSNIIDVYIRFLRRKIDKQPYKKLIHTVWGTGYVLKVER